MTSAITFPVACLLLVLPLTAAAQSNDAAYCAALSKLVYTIDQQAAPMADVGNALSQCQTGTPPYGIPVLERVLKDAKVSLPART
jgi:hypothetical protein